MYAIPRDVGKGLKRLRERVRELEIQHETGRSGEMDPMSSKIVLSGGQAVGLCGPVAHGSIRSYAGWYSWRKGDESFKLV
ncbi:hypothetical protein Tco_1155672 [Tanacetum coccineum]